MPVKTHMSRFKRDKFLSAEFIGSRGNQFVSLRILPSIAIRCGSIYIWENRRANQSNSVCIRGQAQVDFTGTLCDASLADRQR